MCAARCAAKRDRPLSQRPSAQFCDVPFYFPHNLDFRGRAYPIPPYLNHLGNDLCRGLLLYDEAKPLGADGLFWLKIHLANMFGYDKYSFAERIQFVDTHSEDILDSARDPLGRHGGRCWWRTADEPWQTLAACMEYANAVHHPGGPSLYPCRLPVQMVRTAAVTGRAGCALTGSRSCDRLSARRANRAPGRFL